VGECFNGEKTRDGFETYKDDRTAYGERYNQGIEKEAQIEKNGQKIKNRQLHHVNKTRIFKWGLNERYSHEGVTNGESYETAK